MSSDEVLKLANVADKYMLTEALRYTAERWPGPTDDDGESLADIDLFKLLKASKLFDNPRAFNKVCKYMVAWYSSYQDDEPLRAVFGSRSEWLWRVL